MMQRRRLGNSDIEITPVGFGAWAIGGKDWQWGWGPQDDAESIAAIRAALEMGVNWIDTAAVYGLGRSEQVVARALEGVSPRPYVFTKCERAWNDQGQIVPCLKADSIRRECEASLRRLGVDVIDLYQIHWPQPDEDVEEGWTEMARLKEEGKVREIGVSNFSVSQLERALAIAPVTSLQPRYSLLHRDVEQEILPFVAERNIGVIVYSPMGCGMLTGAMSRERIEGLPDSDWRKSASDFTEPALSRNLGIADKLAEIASRHGRCPGEAAIAWVLRRGEVTGAIVGARRAEQVRGVYGAAGWRLSEEEIAEIEAFVRSA